MIDAAIVGLGWWGKNIVNAVQGKSDRLRFQRAVCLEPRAVQDFAASHGLALSTDLADVLRDARIGVVVIATPHSLHPDQAIATALSGKAVFCEKPLALRRADALRIVEACRHARVPLGLGANKRFWPSMQELSHIVAAGRLGEILHIEGNYSNENSRKMFAGWRDSPVEAPGGAMTGTALHILDAFVHLIGPVNRVQAQLLSRRPPPDPLDAVSVLIEFANGASGLLASMRPSPFFWRVHVFGTTGSAEAIGETDVVLRLAGEAAERRTFTAVDSLRAELDAFADAVTGKAPWPIPSEEMINTTAAFEAVITSIEQRTPVAVGTRQ